MQYKLYEIDGVQQDMIILIKDDGSVWGVPNDPANRDWKDYQAWLDLGNTPDPADEE